MAIFLILIENWARSSLILPSSSSSPHNQTDRSATPKTINDQLNGIRQNMFVGNSIKNSYCSRIEMQNKNQFGLNEQWTVASE